MSHLLLSDYGLIGDQSSAALVSRLGSIDWCCLPFLDSPSHFAALLDETQGGRFQIMPLGDFRSEQRYLQRTQVLETMFETPHGRAVLLDWMPLDGNAAQEATVCRRIEMIDGKITWQLSCAPRFAYGEQTARAEHHRDAILFRGADPADLCVLRAQGPLRIELSGHGAAATARFGLESGQSAQFTWGWGRRSRALEFPSVQPTVDRWRAWAHRCPAQGCVFAGPWHDAVVRSSLVLRLLANPYLGSIAEAVTTSLPGVAGGGRTWDYRYAWVRDGAAAIQALIQLGYREESSSFFAWLSDILARDGAEGLQPVYRVDGGKLLPESELEFLAGYQGSRPVRIGNQSAGKFQLDIFGHVLLAAGEHHRVFGELPAGLWPKLAEIADFVCQAWRRPDYGPWEVRSKPEHFVGSKVLCWAALDRAGRLARKLGQPTSPRWDTEREILHRTIIEQGFDETQFSFVRSFGSRDLDTSSLHIPMLGFLPFDDPRVQGTLHALQAQLSNGVLMYRYRASDGIEGQEGPHLPSSFLYVSCLAFCGRVDEAIDRLAELCTFATPMGLFGEQIDPATGETSGNFPSAAVHIGLINAALHVGLARSRQLGTSLFGGSDRAAGDRHIVSRKAGPGL